MIKISRAQYDEAVSRLLGRGKFAAAPMTVEQKQELIRRGEQIRHARVQDQLAKIPQQLRPPPAASGFRSLLSKLIKR